MSLGTRICELFQAQASTFNFYWFSVFFKIVKSKGKVKELYFQSRTFLVLVSISVFFLISKFWILGLASKIHFACSSHIYKWNRFVIFQLEFLSCTQIKSQSNMVVSFIVQFNIIRPQIHWRQLGKIESFIMSNAFFVKVNYKPNQFETGKIEQFTPRI